MSCDVMNKKKSLLVLLWQSYSQSVGLIASLRLKRYQISLHAYRKKIKHILYSVGCSLWFQASAGRFGTNPLSIRGEHNAVTEMLVKYIFQGHGIRKASTGRLDLSLSKAWVFEQWYKYFLSLFIYFSLNTKTKGKLRTWERWCL